MLRARRIQETADHVVERLEAAAVYNQFGEGDSVMSKKHSHRRMGIVFGLLIVAISGCVPNRIDVAKIRMFSVETVPCENIDFIRLQVRREGEDLLLSGTLERITQVSYSISEHVDIVILAPDGSIVAQAKASVRRSARPRTTRQINMGRFKTRFQDLRLTSFRVRVVCHGSPHE